MSGSPRSDAIAGVVSAVSVAHDDADVATIERATARDPVREVARLLDREEVREAFVLQTCNRAERYVVTPDHETGRRVLHARVDGLAPGTRRTFDHDDAIEHLLRIGAGLESMVLGEDQIIGQLRDAIEGAEEADGLGEILDPTVWKAIHLGERVRSTTGINDGIRSVSRAAVTLADRHVELETADVIVVGAGDMARRTGQAIADARGDPLVIANRSVEHARELVATSDFEATVVPLTSLSAALADADIVFTATASQDPIVTTTDVRDAGDLIVIDIGQPRDVDPRVDARAGVTAFDLDDLEAITASTARSRSDAVTRVESMIATEREALHDQLKRRQADDVVAAMHAQAERIKQRELAEARSRLSRDRDLTDRERDVLASFADALVAQLMAAPTRSLREAAAADDWHTIQTALGLFDPELPDGAATLDEIAEPSTDGSSVEPEHGD